MHEVENLSANSNGLAHKNQDFRGQKLKALEAQVNFRFTLMSFSFHKVIIHVHCPVHTNFPFIFFFILKHQILDLKKKQESQVQLLKQKEKSEEAAKRLQTEIQNIKAQKVGIHLLS